MGVSIEESPSERLGNALLDSFGSRTTDTECLLRMRYRDIDQGDQHRNRTRPIGYATSHPCIGLDIETQTFCPFHRGLDMRTVYLHHLGLPPLQGSLLVYHSLES
ncbi:hypothetical protein V8B97DRAFT_1956598 [Scleroderma yunnanense]